jgi:hypothetical protein
LNKRLYLRKSIALKIFLIFIGITCSLISYSQDTTWVKTFTFDSITTRRANFTFPEELNSKRFEKVLMYYKLKCSPLTTWDQYNCGEWDYLTYTRVFDHTGIYDSVRVDKAKYLANCQAPALINYTPIPYLQADNYQRIENFRSNPSLSSIPLNTSNSSSALPFNTSKNGGKYQMLLTAAELSAAGIQAGNIQSLALFLNSLGTSGDLLFPSISIKTTTDSELTSFHASGFNQVYNASHGLTLGELNLGENELLFYQAYAWNGTDNLIIEFSFENDYPVANSLEFQTQTINGNTALNFEGKNGVLEFNGGNYAMLELSDLSIGNELSIEFWSKGNGIGGSNSTFLEAYDTLNNRIVNIHMPWSNNNMYFDAGISSGYDRINKMMTSTEMDNSWNHWAFVKKQTSGEMFIYKNGVLWHSGTNLNRVVGYIHRLVIGSSMNQSLFWKGEIDEFRIYNTALSQATIAANYKNKIDATHPNWSNLLAYYDFDDINYCVDRSQNDYKLMLSQGSSETMGSMLKWDELPLAGVVQSTKIPRISFGQGTVLGNMDSTTVIRPSIKEPIVIFEQEVVNKHFEILNSFIGVPSGTSNTFSPQGEIINTTPYSTSTQLINDTITYYNTPYEIIKDVEIARYITPYGIQFDLGPNGFAWIYDVTDYQDYLRNTVDLAAHNTQELLDLRFAFIEGIPPRDLHKREPIWSDFRSYNFGNMANDIVLPATNVLLSDTSEMFKIKTRMSGHGQVGDYACCEWVNNNHQINVNGVPRFQWNIWQDTECGENPNIGQGGTWPYAREGWCPGDLVKEHEFELTPFVTPGDTVSLDYVINQVPTTDPGQGGGNYIAAYDLISYSEPNFQNDAAIKDVLNPNNYEYYSKYNPTCSNPRVILKNTGEMPLTSCKIVCWITYGDNIEYNWTGNLNFLEEIVVEIPVTNNSWWTDLDSNMTFTAYVRDVNGSFGNDEYQLNSVKTTKFDAPERIDGPFFIWLTTNNKANENNYRLIDHAGNILFERNNLTNQTQYKDTFNLAPGCYSIIIEDTDDDGLSFWYSAQVEGETAGTMRLRKVGGTYIEFFPGDFGSYHRYDFSVGFELGIDETDLEHKIAIFPNPTNGMTTIEVNGAVNEQASIEIYDLMGRKIYSEEMNASQYFAESFIDLSAVNSGTYIVKIITNQRVYTKELIKQ